jgi:hypothetical protein
VITVRVNGVAAGYVTEQGPHQWRAYTGSPGTEVPGPGVYRDSRQATQAVVAAALTF